MTCVDGLEHSTTNGFKDKSIFFDVIKLIVYLYYIRLDLYLLMLTYFVYHKPKLSLYSCVLLKFISVGKYDKHYMEYELLGHGSRISTSCSTLCPPGGNITTIKFYFIIYFFCL